MVLVMPKQSHSHTLVVSNIGQRAASRQSATNQQAASSRLPTKQQAASSQPATNQQAAYTKQPGH
jgi:hypothetical protein